VVYGNNEILALGDEGDGKGSTILSSKNGREWIRRDGIQGDLCSGIWQNNKWVAVGSAIVTSEDGLTWTPRTSIESARLTSISWTGSMFVAAGYGIGNSRLTPIQFSKDGLNWVNGDEFTANAMVWTGTELIAIDNGLRISKSDSGSIWNIRSGAIDKINGNLNGIVSVNGKHVVVGGTGIVATGRSLIFESSDGINWMARYSGNTPILRSIAYGMGTFVAVGDSGLILTSANETSSIKPKRNYKEKRSRIAFDVLGRIFNSVFNKK
jgi:hypothetical protein